MRRTPGHRDFVQAFVGLLPDSRTVRGQPADFWNQLGVRVDRVVSDAADPDHTASALSSRLGVTGLQILSSWLGVRVMATADDCALVLAEHIATSLPTPSVRDILFLLQFVFGRRHEAIEKISAGLIPADSARLVAQGSLAEKSRKFAYAMLVYYQNPAGLRLLMLFEQAERVGYARCSLAAKRSRGGRAMTEDAVQAALSAVGAGPDVRSLDTERVNGMLGAFEARRGNRRRSACFGVHHAPGGVVSIFILRELREASIREVDRTVFGDEAELIVLRSRDGLRSMEQHSADRAGVEIAEALAADLLGNSDIEYVPDEARTATRHLRALLDVLQVGRDDSLRLREIDLKHAPIDGSPDLILRCDKSVDLAPSLAFLAQKGLPIGDDLDDIRALGVVAERRITDEGLQSYIMRVTADKLAADREFYIVRYSQRGSPAPTDFRSYFEQILRERYHVNAIPGAREKGGSDQPPAGTLD